VIFDCCQCLQLVILLKNPLSAGWIFGFYLFNDCSGNPEPHMVKGILLPGEPSFENGTKFRRVVPASPIEISQNTIYFEKHDLWRIDFLSAYI